jgi:hypothetical protein
MLSIGIAGQRRSSAARMTISPTLTCGNARQFLERSRRERSASYSRIRDRRPSRSSPSIGGRIEALAGELLLHRRLDAVQIMSVLEEGPAARRRRHWQEITDRARSAGMMLVPRGL